MQDSRARKYRQSAIMVRTRTFLVSLVVLENLWLLEVDLVEAQKKPQLCSQPGAINVTKTSERNETCGTLVNYTYIMVCENDGLREMCDEDFSKLDAQVICRQLGNSTVGAGAGRLHQGVGAFASNFFPMCNGQESSITDCARMDHSGECNSNKIFVTCFIDDPTSGPSCRNSYTGSPPTAPPTATTSEVSADTPVVHPTLTSTSTGSNDPTSYGTDYVLSIPSTNVGVPDKQDPLGTTYIIIIIVAVSSASVICLLMVITFAAIKYKRRHSKSDATNIHYGSDPIDVKESVLYSEIMDDLTDLEQSQQDSSPFYETIKVTKSEDTAGVPVSATDVCPVDLKENIAYEASPADLKENIAYETRLNPVDLQENIAYETSKKIHSNSDQ